MYTSISLVNFVAFPTGTNILTLYSYMNRRMCIYRRGNADLTSTAPPLIYHWFSLIIFAVSCRRRFRFHFFEVFEKVFGKITYRQTASQYYPAPNKGSLL